MSNLCKGCWENGAQNAPWRVQHALHRQPALQIASYSLPGAISLRNACASLATCRAKVYACCYSFELPSLPFFSASFCLVALVSTQVHKFHKPPRDKKWQSIGQRHTPLPNDSYKRMNIHELNNSIFHFALVFSPSGGKICNRSKCQC